MGLRFPSSPVECLINYRVWSSVGPRLQVGLVAILLIEYVPPPGQTGGVLIYLSVPYRSPSVGVAPVVALFSSAHCSFAPSICLRLLMHAFFCAVLRAFTKLGIAIAASNPMIATTIMISTNVNPDLRVVVSFIGLPFCLVVCLNSGVNLSAGTNK